MYSTRRLHKNVVEGAAYITINDPYNGNKAPAPDRWKGRRLACPAHPRPFFTPFTYTSEPAPKAEKPQPSETTAKPGFGFGSRDASKRDQYALTRSTEAYRETLRKEFKLANSKRGGGGGGGGGSSGSGSGSPEQPAAASARSFLYDIGRGRTTAFNPKLRRDTYYALAQTQQGGESRGPGRRLGSHRLTSQDVGQGIWTMEHAPPEVTDHIGEFIMLNRLTSS
jgi:hypothetical protein